MMDPLENDVVFFSSTAFGILNDVILIYFANGNEEIFGNYLKFLKHWTKNMSLFGDLEDNPRTLK